MDSRETVRTSSWHFRLNRRAYVEDRGWLDAGWLPEATPTDLPEQVAFIDFREAMGDKYGEHGSHYLLYGKLDEEDHDQWRRLEEKKREAEFAWYEQARQDYSDGRAAEMRKRLYDGMHICPYFWNWVRAIFVYTLLVRPGRFVSSQLSVFLRMFGSALAKACLVLVVGAVVIGSVSVLYDARREVVSTVTAIPEVPDKVAGFLREQQRAREETREYERQVVLERVNWERAHPEEVRAREIREIERRKAEIAESRRVFLSGLVEIAKLFGLAVAATLALIVGVAVFVGLVWGLSVVFSPVGMLISRVFSGLMDGMGKTGTAIRESRVFKFVRWLGSGLRRFCADTIGLMMGFAKAAHVQVCWKLKVIDDEDQEA